MTLPPSDPHVRADDKATHRKFGFRDGVRWAVTWLHDRAKEMNDPHAVIVLNSAAFNMGEEAKRRSALLPSPTGGKGSKPTEADYADAYQKYLEWEKSGTGKFDIVVDLIWQRAQSAAPRRAGAILEFTNLILHGDEEHRRWLMEAANAYLDGKPMPPPRAQAAVDERAEPVAWLVKTQRTVDPVFATFDKSEADRFERNGYGVTPLYTHPLNEREIIARFAERNSK